MFQSVYEYALGLNSEPDCTDTSSYKGNYFGVFVGVTRSEAHTIPQWPQNIHGSIGYWDRNFKRVDADALCEHTHRVALDAAKNDDRKKFFPELLTDIEAVLDVKFMCLPILDIDAHTGLLENGAPFDNEGWGLLVQSKAGAGATFLPGVFKHTTWDTIKTRVVSKAGLEAGAKTVRFYAYRTKRSAAALCHIYCRASSFKLLTKIGCGFLDFVEGCEHVPYAVTPQQTVVYDETQDVRNIATLLNVRRLSPMISCKSNSKSTMFSAETTHYVRKYVKHHASMQQASAFLLPLLQELQLYPELQTTIARRLTNNLGSMEPSFELGESLVALKKRLPMRTAQSVFELNWQAQVWPRRALCDPLRSYASEFTSKTETNYLAVAFEAACMLHMPKLAHALFCKLMQRYDARRGLFRFLDGSSRVDITCHVHSGLMRAIKRDPT